MSSVSLAHLLRGPFNFLRLDDDEIRRIVPDAERVLPQPQRIFLEDESATNLRGFPILVSAELQELGHALAEYLAAEAEVQVVHLRRQGSVRPEYGAAWERYRGLLSRAIENVTVSSFGRHHPGIFWLHQSLDVSRLLKEAPKRILRLDLRVGREHGDELKYRVLDRYVDRVLALTYDVVNRLADDTEEIEQELFPPLLTRMRDNVLIFTETHISHNLAELGSYFNGYLHLDGRDLRARLAALADWHERQLRADPELQVAVAHLIGTPSPVEHGPELLKRSGYLSFLATRREYDPERLPTPPQVEVWESLLLKLKEFELLHALRKLIVPMERDGGALLARDRGGVRTPGAKPLHLSSTTRPLDFMRPWVVDPQVDRCGMIYDISDFSEIISLLRWAGSEAQDDSFRMIFRFQRRVNRLAVGRRLTLEKYLGDGAFYSGREARRVLATALQIQRYYRQLVAQGFPFNRGLRIALNHGQYRLFPIQGAVGGGPERYEFFGHGLVELSRLVTGKAARDVDEIKTLLVNLGYPESAVNRFFAPLAERNVDIVDKQQQSRPFYAYINQNGTLVNEGIVATGAFIAQLAKEGGGGLPRRARLGDQAYVVVRLEDGGGPYDVGLRKLGVARFKGIDRLAVYEVIDAEGLETQAVAPDTEGGLIAVIEREFLSSFGRRELSPAAESEGWL